MFDEGNRSSRRTFLHRAGAMFAAMHLPIAARAPGRIAPPQPAGDAPPPRAARPVDFRQLDLLARNMDAQREFYTRAFHLPVVNDTADSFTVQAGATRLRFIDAGSAGFAGPILCHFAFNIPENRLESALAWVESRRPLLRHRQTGETIVHFPSINAHSIYWFDPAGHLVEFIARHDLPNASDHEFSEADIIQASEIGLVTPDVGATCAELERRLGVRIRDGYRGNEMFAPTGDDHGYFIVVREERVWLMTDIPAVRVPIKVDLGAESAGQLTLDGVPFEVRLTK
jgi:catechol-2,3-dioxygenase